MGGPIGVSELTYAGRVAHSALHLVQYPTGRGCRGHVPVDVYCHCSDSAHLPPTKEYGRVKKFNFTTHKVVIGKSSANNTINGKSYIYAINISILLPS